MIRDTTPDGHAATGVNESPYMGADAATADGTDPSYVERRTGATYTTRFRSGRTNTTS
jgi:hypothetical protein